MMTHFAGNVLIYMYVYIHVCMCFANVPHFFFNTHMYVHTLGKQSAKIKEFSAGKMF